MEDYIRKFETLDKSVIFIFSMGDGGIGDLVKFFTFLLHQCILRDIKLYCVNRSDVGKYITMKHSKMSIDPMIETIPLQSLEHLNNLLPGMCYTCTVGVMYAVFPFGEALPNIDLEFPYDQVFDFSEEVKMNVSMILTNPVEDYISIHLRLGDKFLETDYTFIVCHEDARPFDQDLLDTFIQNTPGPLLFFCDNHSYKERIQRMYPQVMLTTGAIGHTSLLNTTEKQVLDTVTEFYILTKSSHIVSASFSGFSVMASRFQRKPITYLF